MYSRYNNWENQENVTIAITGLGAMAKDSKSFRNSFFRLLAENNPDNLICSPLSAEVVLAIMASYGARGRTASEMRRVLHLPNDHNIWLLGYQCLFNELNNEQKVVLRLASRIFTASRVEIKPPYKELADSKFPLSIRSLDFSDSTAAARAINYWCGDQTDNRTGEVVGPGDFQPDTLFVLVNAVYFKGEWEQHFLPLETSNRPFLVDGTTTKLLPTMFKCEYYVRCGNLPVLDARLLEMPYKGGALSMIILLPNSIAGLNKVENKLEQVNLRQCLQDVKQEHKVNVSLPKFKIECTFDLKPTLAKLGMNTMFETAADFSGIGDGPLNITKAVQTAYIEVNESGTGACASSHQNGRAPLIEDPITFTVDRPFYITIFHRRTGISLFNGIVKAPRV